MGSGFADGDAVERDSVQRHVVGGGSLRYGGCVEGGVNRGSGCGCAFDDDEVGGFYGVADFGVAAADDVVSFLALAAVGDDEVGGFVVAGMVACMTRSPPAMVTLLALTTLMANRSFVDST